MPTQEKITHQWAALIKTTRKQLNETQEVFGARFGVTYAAVSDWERGRYDPPANVTWWLANNYPRTIGTTQ